MRVYNLIKPNEICKCSICVKRKSEIEIKFDEIGDFGERYTNLELCKRCASMLGASLYDFINYKEEIKVINVEADNMDNVVVLKFNKKNN